jgi:pyridoxal phosphate enzyme (YggS family)
MSKLVSNALFIKENLFRVREQVRICCQASGREQNEVQLLAVSKTKPKEVIQAAYELGQRAFGENYVQEGVDKVLSLQALTEIEWYFIGALQANKAKAVAEHFDWVLTVDREKIARRLNELRPQTLKPLNVCIQINVSNQASKTGVALSEVKALAENIQSYPQLKLRGLMAIPDPSLTETDLKEQFLRLKRLFESLQAQYQQIDTLSMGMSQDLDAAIACGSTQVRVGTAIFGSRQSKPNE